MVVDALAACGWKVQKQEKGLVVVDPADVHARLASDAASAVPCNSAVAALSANGKSWSST